MTVSELIAALTSLPRSAEVIIQKDAEGNGYSPLYAVDGNCIYQPETTWSGTVLSTDWSADDVGLEPAKWDALKSTGARCVVLAPRN